MWISQLRLVVCLKAPIHRKKWIVLPYLRKFFFSKRRFYTSCCIWLLFPFDHDLCLFSMFLYLSLFSPYHVLYSRFFLNIREKGLWEERKISGRKYSVDTLADTATIRSSHRGCSVRKGVLRNLQNSQENTCAGLIPAALFKKRLWLRCFLVKFAKFLRTPFLQNISGRVLLNCWLWLCQFVKSVKKRMLSIEEYWFMDKLFLLV